MLDVVLRGGMVIDGTGAEARQADVGVRDGRIVEVGDAGDAATETIDADGLIVAPGFIDPHTHYDAQLFWDPSASPSNLHGVTTVIGGNCGFTLAPLDPDDSDYLRRMMAQVEGMPLEALERGTDWGWHGFGEYLSRFDGGLGVNAAFMVGHCALRRRVMGEAAVGEEASPDQLEEMRQLLAESLEAGGLGLSTTRAFTHSDGDGQPVPSRHATPDEVLALCAEVERHEGTTLEAITDGCLNGFSDDEIDLFTRMSVTAKRPLNWNVLTIDAKAPERTQRQLEMSTYAREAGGRVVALTMPVLVGMNMSFRTYCALFLLPGWRDVLDLPIPERMARLRDPDVRRMLDERAHSPEAGVVGRLAGWGRYEIGDTFSPENEGLKGRTVADIAAERGRSAFDTLLDIVLADELRTVLWPSPTDDDPESWATRARVWQDERVLIGGSDAGAHLDRMCGAPYTTAFLGDCARGRQLLPLTEAVRLITSAPADLFGLRGRGRVEVGASPTWWSSIPGPSTPARWRPSPISPGARRGSWPRRGAWSTSWSTGGAACATAPQPSCCQAGSCARASTRARWPSAPGRGRASAFRPTGTRNLCVGPRKRDDQGGFMYAIGQMSNSVAFIFYAVGIVCFALAAIGIALHEKLTNLVALGLFAVFFPVFWDHLAAL